MEPSVQFDPGRCVLVLGPQIAAASLALKEIGPPTAALSYAMLFESGMQKMLELESATQGKEEKIRKQSLLAGAYELDPSFVASTVVESLRDHDKYEQWLSDSFKSLYSLPVHNGPGSIIEELRQLQEKGVLLVYTYYDSILDNAMETAPVLMDSDEDVKNWGSHKTSGILHVHGIHSQTSSVMCDCVNYGRIVGDSSTGRRLREICRNRTVIFIGFDGRFYDPLLPKFASTFLHSSHAQQQLQHSVTGLLLTFTGCPTNHRALLKVKLPTMAGGLGKFLVPTLSPYKPAPREGVDPSKSLNTTLLYADKSSCSDAAEKVKTMAAVKVHQLTISHEQHSHQLLLYLDHEGLRNLWRVLFSLENSNSSLHSGLLGVVLDSGVTVWCQSGGNGRLEGGGSSSKVTAMEASSASSSHPTLSTTVSLIGSMWTPIATPSVVSQQQPPKQLVPATSTRPTLPSPLITSHSSLSLSTKGLTPELPRHVGLLSPHSAHRREIREVRRVQSERSNLSYQDRINEMKAAGKRNGVLLHRESAPEFVYTPEGLVAYRADSMGSHHHHHQQQQHHPLRHHSPAVAAAAAAAAAASSSQKPSSVSQPSPLVRDGGNLELKIEYIDQFQHGSAKSSSSGSHPSAAGFHKMIVSPSSSSRSGPDGASAVDRRNLLGVSEKKDILGKFSEEKQKWIKDALSWSKKLSTDIHKLSGAPPQSLLNSAKSSSSCLSTNISLEEQERILQQHFDMVKSQSQAKLTLPVSSVSSPSAISAAAAAMSRLPLSSLSSLSSSSSVGQPRSIAGTPGTGVQTPSKSPHPSPRPSPNLSPIQLAAAISAAAANSTNIPGSGGSSSGSPKKSPILLGSGIGGAQPPQSSSAGGSIFSYFSSNPAAAAAAAAALQNPAASFLYNPAVSQYAAAAAAMFNPFQAAVQLLSPQQQQQQQQAAASAGPGGSTKTSSPLLLADPSLLQNLQQSLPDKLPLILPDGSITLVPTNFGAQTPASQIPTATSRESPIPATMSLKSPNTVSSVFGFAAGGGGGGDLKRTRSPDDDDLEVRSAPPKRRRSSSLPDIAQLSQLEVKGAQQESIREDEERENDRAGVGGDVISGAKLARPQLLVKHPQHRQTPPPNMIQIPHQDMKLSDPMLGFPTPPQSSPLIGNFALSPFVLSTPTFQNPTPMTPVTPGQEPLSTEELRELVEASGGGQTNLPPSPEGTSLPPFPAGRGPIQLWQFLLDLLLSTDKRHMIQWTGNGYEFRILAPEDIAKLWGARKNKPRMNYDKLSRGLRYYYSKGIMDKVPGKKLTFKYTCDVQHYVRSRNVQAMRSSNFPNGGTPTPTGGTGGAVGGPVGGVVLGGVSSAHQATPHTSLIPGGITIAASAVTVDDGSKPSPHQRLDSASLGSPEEDDRDSMNLIISHQTSNMCSTSDGAEFCKVEEA